MVEPVAKPAPPLTCYGLEQDSQAAQCRDCPHRAGCAEAMGSRVGKVPLMRAKVQLDAPLEALEAADPDEDDLLGIYSLCYSHVFNDRPDRFFEQHPGRAAEVVQSARELNCPLRLYVYAVMMSYKDTGPDLRFYGGKLAGPSAAKRVKLYREAARDLYGVFDTGSVSQLTGEGSDRLKSAIEASEELAGSYIVGHKARYTSSASAALYSERELGLHPAWLASEHSYVAWCRVNPADTAELRRHRARVARLDRRSWPEIARLRAPVVIPLAVRLLRRAGVDPEDVAVPRVIDDSVAFWTDLGVLVRQATCLAILNGEPTAMAGRLDLRF